MIGCCVVKGVLSERLKSINPLALLSHWLCLSFAEREKKKRKEENRSKAPSVQEKPQETKSEVKPEEAPEKKKEKPKSLRTTAPSHAKFRSTGKRS